MSAAKLPALMPYAGCLITHLKYGEGKCTGRFGTGSLAVLLPRPGGGADNVEWQLDDLDLARTVFPPTHRLDDGTGCP